IPNRQARKTPAHADVNWNVRARSRMRTPSALKAPPKYSPTTAPIIESTAATLSPLKTNGRAVGIRTRRKICTCPAAYDSISSSARGFTEVRPRSVFTSTGKKQRTAAMTIFELFVIPPENHWFVIGAKAMIGIAFAAIARDELEEARLLARYAGPRLGQVDRDEVGDAPRPRRHDDDAGREEDRLGDRVR